MTPKPVVDKKCILKKFPGKGGWTYLPIPEIDQRKDKYFGMVRVHGKIDSYQFSRKNLMPDGNGTLFLPVNATIRKAIGKGEGNRVHLTLYLEEVLQEEKAVNFLKNSPLEIPEDIITCFKNEPPEAYHNFQHLSEDRKRQWLQWIYGTGEESIRAKRIITMMDQLLYHTK